MSENQYRRAAKFFHELRAEGYNLRNGSANLEEVKELIKGRPDSSLSNIFIHLRVALECIHDFDASDLENLADAGFAIHESLFGAHAKYYLKESQEIEKRLKEEEITTEFFDNSIIDNMKMFARFLDSYSYISEYEAKVLDDQKKEALRKVLEARKSE